MIYFDNSATTLTKPPAVSEAVAYAINNFGSAGRSFYDAAMRASREIYTARLEIAKLIGLDDPLNVAFTSSATESLNLVIAGLIGENDTVITTVTEHNSVLRPLYLTGCDLRFMDCDEHGVPDYDSFNRMIELKPRFLVCTHGSNVTGNITDALRIYNLCKSNGVTMILDISQTFGVVPVSIGMADIFCFTGHKGLFGPQGTGGIIINGKHDFNPVKTGGAGTASFDRVQSKEMPDIFEVGTLNSHGIYGLQKGTSFVNETGIGEIYAKEKKITKMFYDGVKRHGRVKVYGNFSTEDRLPIVSLNVEGLDSSGLAERIWDTYGIAVRAGSHCAPLLHKRLGTADIGMVRFSFSYFNSEREIEKGISAIDGIVKSMG